MDTVIEKRLERLRKQLTVTEVDTLLIFSPENRRYFSGFTGEDGDGYESAGALIITEDRLFLTTDSRYETQARQEAIGFEVVCYQTGLAKDLPGILTGLNSSRVGFDAGRLSHAGFKSIAKQIETAGLATVLVDADSLLAGIRVRKDDREIEIMRRSLTLAENVFADFLEETLAPGVSERDAAWDLERRMREAGAEAMAFPVIAAFGENSALPHAKSGDRILQKDEPILFDWGARLDGYCSDISRSFVLGKADATYRKVYNAVYEAQQRATEAIRPGVSAGKVDAVARKHIDKAGFKGRFGHGLGHGVGLAIHEAPRVGSTSEDLLEEGMVFTVEPGIYIPGWGGVRLENMVVVRADGCDVLNRLELRREIAA